MLLVLESAHLADLPLVMNRTDDHATVRVETAAGLAALAERYDDLHELGRGGMGIVYRARDKQTGDTVAVKVLRAEVMTDPQAAERFKDELLLARRITHKNVCRVYEINRFANVAAISMEYVAGESLRVLLEQVGSVSVRHGTRILSQILDGLAEAHAQGVIHRDLKPENILIDGQGWVKVMDFGIARATGGRDHSTTTTLTGTPAYMSPEQIAGKPADARSDIYALGLMMYEMFCGQPAFSADDPIALFAKQTGDVPARPRDVDPDLPARIERVILRCLEKRPERRYQSAAEVLRALASEELAANTPTPRVESLPASLVRWQQSDWALLVCAVLGMLAFVPLFNATNLNYRSQVTFDRGELERIGREHRQRLGASHSAVASSEIGGYRGAIAYLAEEGGHQQARELAAETGVFSWILRFADRSVMRVDHTGNLIVFWIIILDPSVRPMPEDAARLKAEQALRDWFGIEPSNVTVIGAGTLGSQRTFDWESPAKFAGLTHNYTIGVGAKGLEYVARYLNTPPGHVLPWRPSLQSWYTPVTLVIAFVLMGFGIAARRRMPRTEPWRVGVGIPIGAAGVMVGFSYPVLQGSASRLAASVALGFTLTAAWILVSAVVEHLVTRLDARKLISLRLMFSRSALSAPVGLSVLRGALVGVALLGLDTVGLWTATRHLGATLDLDIHVSLLLMGLRYGAVAALVAAVVQAFWIGSFVAVAAALARGWTTRTWTGPVVAAGVLAMTGAHASMGSFSEPQFVVAQLFLDYLVLVLAFRHHDLLMLFTAVFTFSLWAAAFPLLIILEQVDATGPQFLLALWIVAVMGAAVAAFQTEIGSAYRRAATAFD